MTDQDWCTSRLSRQGKLANDVKENLAAAAQRLKDLRGRVSQSIVLDVSDEIPRIVQQLTNCDWPPHKEHVHWAPVTNAYERIHDWGRVLQSLCKALDDEQIAGNSSLKRELNSAIEKLQTAWLRAVELVELIDTEKSRIPCKTRGELMLLATRAEHHLTRALAVAGEIPAPVGGLDLHSSGEQQRRKFILSLIKGQALDEPISPGDRMECLHQLDPLPKTLEVIIGTSLDTSGQPDAGMLDFQRAYGALRQLHSDLTQSGEQSPDLVAGHNFIQGDFAKIVIGVEKLLNEVGTAILDSASADLREVLELASRLHDDIGRLKLDAPTAIDSRRKLLSSSAHTIKDKIEGVSKAVRLRPGPDAKLQRLVKRVNDIVRKI